MSQGLVWAFSDISVAVMTILNLTAVLWLRKEVRAETESAGLCLPRRRRKREAGSRMASSAR